MRVISESQARRVLKEIEEIDDKLEGFLDRLLAREGSRVNPGLGFLMPGALEAYAERDWD